MSLICTSLSSSSSSSSPAAAAGAGLDGSDLISGSSSTLTSGGESSLTAAETDRVLERDTRLRFVGVDDVSTAGAGGGGVGARNVCVFSWGRYQALDLSSTLSALRWNYSKADLP